MKKSTTSRLGDEVNKRAVEFLEYLQCAVNSADGSDDALCVLVAIRKLAQGIKYLESNSEIQCDALGSSKFLNAPFEMYGRLVSSVATGAHWDFSVCGDPEWERLSQEAKTACGRLSRKEAELQKLHAPVTDGDSVMQPPRYSCRHSVKVATIKEK